ncbi:MAG: cytochrome bc complex cytochrome b subunit [Anaerolineae bacterium]|nr:cytochrome bc complex cytochrome b subunit [Anaerolineae bacterium]
MAIIGQKLVNQIRETGLKATVAQRTDDAFTRFTAGLTWDDVRGILRGDPPAKPNPRVKPHTEGFWFHIRPTFYHEAVTTLYPTFRLGYLSALFFLIETITGMFLMIFYTPSPERAFANMIDILTNVPFGSFMRDLHRLGAEVMVVVVTLHMWRTFITASYKKPRQFTWFTGVVLLIVTMFLSFSGYLLPWDQLAFWAVTIGTSMADAAPLVGREVNLLLRGAPDIGAGGLLRFYLFHVLLFPAIGLVFLGVHYYKVVRWGLSLPPEMEAIGEDTARKVDQTKRVMFMPDILTNEIMYAAVATAILAVASATFYNAPLETHSNPQVTPLHTVAPWYFYWLQGLIKIPHILPLGESLSFINKPVDEVFALVGLTPKMLWGIIVPPIIIVLLFAIPYIDPNPSRRYKDRKVALSLAVIFELLILYLSLGGIATGVPGTGFGYVGGNPVVEVAQEFIPDEGESEVKAIPFDQLIVGKYPLANDPAIDDHKAPKFREIVRAIYADMEHRKHVADPLGKKMPEEAEGDVTVRLLQEDLKEFVITIRYIDENQAPQTFSKNAYIHKNSDYH